MSSIKPAICKPHGQSTLHSASFINPKGKKKKKGISATLLLTSLVDAFSILVLFLMISSGNPQEEIKVGELTLPKATSGLGLVGHTSLRIEKGQIFLNDVAVSRQGLAAHLEAAREAAKNEEAKESVLFVADKGTNYGDINSLIIDASEAGFKTFKFAVVADK